MGLLHRFSEPMSSQEIDASEEETIEEWDIVLRICGAAALAALVGFEREASNKPACVKMHMLVAAAAATFVGAALLNTQKWMLGDVNRVAAGVASGVGFLGAGTIAKKEMQVSGLITAAGIWLVAGIGFAVANGYWYIGTLVALLAVVIQFGFFFFLSPKFWNDMRQKFLTNGEHTKEEQGESSKNK